MPNISVRTGRKKKKMKGPLWRGPAEDGITYSLLCRFLVCRERFRLLVVEGLHPADDFSHRLEYGQMWHACDAELAAGRGNWLQSLKRYRMSLSKRYPLRREEIEKWYNVCRVQFPLYVDYWHRHPIVRHRQPLLQEQVFAVPYKLPSGRTVLLRGKWDSVALVGKGNWAQVYLQENKTKGDIREQQLRQQLRFDLQTMLYLIALKERIDRAKVGDRLFPKDHGRPAGVIYNVVRRPLSGGRYSISRYKPTKSRPQGESAESFYQRLGKLIGKEPEFFFMRWKVEINPSDIERFKQRCLNPLLEQLCLWWDWIQSNNDPFQPDPYQSQWNTNPLHWQTPYGFYNPLAEGRATELDEYIETGSKLGLERVSSLFEELE